MEKNAFTDCGDAAVIRVDADVTVEENELEHGLEALAGQAPQG